MPGRQTRPIVRAASVLVGTLTAACGGPTSKVGEVCKGVVALGAADERVGALKDDGSLWTWGAGAGDVPQVEASAWDSASIVRNGFCFKRANASVATCPLVSTDLPAEAQSVSILADESYGGLVPAPLVCAVLSSGVLTCQLYSPGFVDQASQVQVAGVGVGMLCAKDAGGSVFCHATPIPGSTIPALENWEVPSGSLPDLVDVQEMVATRDGFCGRTGNGEVWCWGNSFPFAWGGNGAADPIKSLNRIPGLGGPVKALSAGLYRVCALRVDGAVFCWGHRIGVQDRVVPGRVQTLPAQITTLPGPAMAIVTQADYACALLVEGTIWCWGYSLLGALGNGDVDHADPKPVAACGI
jgi:Regulator of chromosome condensation (RCC1) repeat